MDIAIVAFDGVDELDAVGPYEVFANAADEGVDLAVTLCTLDDAPTVTASHGLTFEAQGRLDDRDPDLLVVPGGQWNARGETGAWAEAERGVLPARVRDLHDAGVTVAGVCTGGMLLARAGVTDGRPATTHRGALDDLRASGATVVDARVVDDGDVVTAGGVTSGIDLALYLVEREFGASVADAVASRMEYERRGETYVSDQ